MIFVHQINRKTTSALIGQNLSLIGTDNPWNTESYFFKSTDLSCLPFREFCTGKRWSCFAGNKESAIN